MSFLVSSLSETIFRKLACTKDPLPMILGLSSLIESCVVEICFQTCYSLSRYNPHIKWIYISSYLACLHIWFRHCIFEYRELPMMLGNTSIIDFVGLQRTLSDIQIQRTYSQYPVLYT